MVVVVAESVVIVRARTVLVVLSGREVLGAQMPVDVHGAEARREVRRGDGRGGRVVDGAHVAPGDVDARLLHRVDDGVGAVKIVEGVVSRLGTFAVVETEQR